MNTLTPIHEPLPAEGCSVSTPQPSACRWRPQPRCGARLLMLVGLALCSGADWPQFRGPLSSSLDREARLPATWSDDQHTAWRAVLPGRGPSSPIVVGDRVFVTATSGVRHDRLHVLCYDAADGRQRWQRQFWATGRTATHDSISGAAPTPASDGRRVFALFSSNDLICLNLDGDLQWYRGLSYDYPQSGSDVALASSPVVLDGAVVVQVESQGEAFAAGIDADTGENLWRIERRRQANWSSPIVLPARGSRHASVLLQSPDRLTAHEPRTGRTIWQLDGGYAGISSSLVSGDLLLVPRNGLTALRLGDGEAAPETVWESSRLRPGSPSPVAWDGRVYTINGAILKCGDLNSGQVQWQLRLAGTHWATPVIAGDLMYCMNYEGQVHVVRLGDEEGAVVGRPSLGQPIHASPALAGNAMYVRSDKYLWKISP